VEIFVGNYNCNLLIVRLRKTFGIIPTTEIMRLVGIPYLNYEFQKNKPLLDVLRNILHRARLTELEQTFFELENSDHILSNLVQIIENALKNKYGHDNRFAKQYPGLLENFKTRLLGAFSESNNAHQANSNIQTANYQIQATNINIFGLMYKEDESLFQIIYNQRDSSCEEVRRSVLWSLSRLKLPPNSENNSKITNLLKSVATNSQLSLTMRKLAVSCLIRHFFVQNWKTENVVYAFKEITKIPEDQSKGNALELANFVESLLPMAIN